MKITQIIAAAAALVGLTLTSCGGSDPAPYSAPAPVPSVTIGK